WGPSLKLANGQWYRFEYYVHYVDATHIQVHPRVYNAAGALILSDADFLQEDYLAGGTWNGRQDWTLASYYAGGFTFCVDPGVAGVQFTLDGTPLGAEMTSAPYSVSWDTTTASNGSHTLRAVARDAAGNQTPSAGVPVTVSNSVPPPPAGGLATLYPGDVGIETHPDVVFVEKFEEATLTDLLNQWTDNLNGAAMAFSPDVPTGSP